MKYSLSMVFAILILTATVANGIYCPVIQQDEIKIIIADFRGPDGSDKNPGDWILINLNEVISDYDNISIVELSRPLAASDPEGDALSLLTSENATMVIWGSFQEEDGMTRMFPCYATGLQVLSGTESVMRGSGSIRPKVYYSSMTDILQLEYYHTEDVVIPGGVWLSMAQTYTGIALNTVGRFSEGTELLEKALAASNPGWLDSEGYRMALFSAGISQMALENTNRSIEIFTDLIELNPEFPSAFQNRGCSYYHQHIYDVAIDDFTRSLEIKPDDPDVLFMRGLAYCRSGMQDIGILDLNRYLELDPDDALTLGNRGYAYYELGMYEEAIRDLSRAVELQEQPATSHSITNLGVAYKDDGQYEKAIECLDAALLIVDNDPTAAIILFHRGDCYCWLNDIERGIDDFTASLELYPERVSTLIIRGRAYLFTGRPEAALSDFERAVQYDPESLRAYYWRGRALASLGYIDQAIEDLDLVIERADYGELRSEALETLESIRR